MIKIIKHLYNILNNHFISFGTTNNFSKAEENPEGQADVKWFEI